MSKDLLFRVELSFSGKIVTDEEIKEVAQKVMDALIHQVDTGMGLAPEDSGEYTEHIRVTPWFLNDETVIHSF